MKLQPCTRRCFVVATSTLLLVLAGPFDGGANYQNFDVASYARVMDVPEVKDPAWLERNWAEVTKYVKLDKIYLETHRDTVMPDQATLDQAKKFFASKGVKVAGGITWTINEHAGETYVLTIPQAQGDLYAYPQPVLNCIRQLLGKELFVRLDAPSRASLFGYDNDKFIVESFRETPVPNARVISSRRITKLNDLLTGEVLTGTASGSATVFNTPLTPGSYRVFAANNRSRTGS